MITALALITAGLAAIVVGLLVRDDRRAARSKRDLLRRLEEDERAALKIMEQLAAKGRLPYWSCQSVARARSLAANCVSQARTVLKQGRALAEVGPEDAAACERRAQVLLGQAEMLCHYAETQVVPLIDRMRRSVETLHGEASQTRALIHQWLGRRPRSAALDEAERRIAKLANALKAHELALAGAPVTTLTSLNVQYRVMNEVLLEIINAGIGDDEPPRQA